jgi:hypothetical protein
MSEPTTGPMPGACTCGLSWNRRDSYWLMLWTPTMKALRWHYSIQCLIRTETELVVAKKHPKPWTSPWMGKSLV